MHYQHYSTPIELSSSIDITPILKTIKALFRKGAICCELGSGDVSTPFLINNGYSVTCFEENKQYLDKHSGATYYYTPISRGWFETTQLSIKTPERTSFFLIDAPYNISHRANLDRNYHIFLPYKAPIFIHCKYDIDLWAAKKLAVNLKRNIVVKHIEGCKYCIIGLSLFQKIKLKLKGL